MKYLLIFILVILTGCNQQVNEISSMEAQKLIEEEEVIVLDVRSVDEYNQGHIENAINIPYEEIDDKIDNIIMYKNKKILLYCRTHNRSRIALETLKKHDFKNIYLMYEGYSEYEICCNR